MKKTFSRKILSGLLTICMVAGLNTVMPLPVDAAPATYVELTKLPDSIQYRLGHFSEGLMRFFDTDKGKYGYIDKYGNTVIPFEYDGATDFSEGLASVMKGQENFFIDKSGKVVISSIPHILGGDFHEGLAAVHLPGETESVTVNGKTITVAGAKYGFIDKSGALVIPTEYDHVLPFSEGLAAVCKDNEGGFIDAKGNVVIPFRYAFKEYKNPLGWTPEFIRVYDITSFSGGVASINDVWIDKTGKAVPAPARVLLEKIAIEKAGSDFSPWVINDNYAVVTRNRSAVGSSTQEVGIIDINGNFTVPFGVYGTINSYKDGLLIANEFGGEYGPIPTGVIDLEGNVIVPFGKYSFFGEIGDDGVIYAQRDGSKYILQVGTSTKTTPPAPALVAKPTASTVLVNGENVAFDAYNIDGSNYFKLRDIALTLSGTEKQFDVGWDGASNAISLTSSKPYTAVGGEMTGKGAGNKTPAPSDSKIILDGKEVRSTAYNIEGNNYFKLRDIAEAFDFSVVWDGARNTIVIDTSKGYTPE